MFNQTVAVKPTGVRVVKLALRYTGTAQPQHIRPYQSDKINGSLLDQYSEIRSQDSINHISMAPIAGQLLRPSTEAGDQINIANGWDQPRFRFIMEIETVGGHQDVIRQVLSGYTDHPGATDHGARTTIDDRMKFFFNSSTTINTQRIFNGNRESVQSVITDSSQLLRPIDSISNSPFGHNTTYGLRPPEVVTRMYTGAGLDGFNLGGMTDDSGGVYVDTRASIHDFAAKSSRRHNRASVYMASTLKALESSALDMSPADEQAMYEQARSELMDPNIGRDRFLAHVRNHTPGSFDTTGFVTWSELKRACPEIDSVTSVFMTSPAVRTYLPDNTLGLGEGANSSTQESIIANIVAREVPSIMMENFFTNMAFATTNLSVTGAVITTITNSNSMNRNVNLSAYIERVRSEIDRLVLFTISRTNQFTVSISGVIDLFGTSHLTISFDSGPAIEFFIPSYCDALTAPVLTNNEAHVSMLSNNFSQFADQGQALDQRYDVSPQPANSFTMQPILDPNSSGRQAASGARSFSMDPMGSDSSAPAPNPSFSSGV